MTDPAPRPALPGALAQLLDELEEKTRTLAELDAWRAALVGERADLQAAVAPLLRRLAPHQLRLAERRMSLMQRSLARPEGAVGTTRATASALDFLAQSEAEEIRAAELTWYLRRMGFAVTPQYAPTLLRDWAGRGVVHRTGRGIYRINRAHRAIFDLRMKALDGRVGG